MLAHEQRVAKKRRSAVLTFFMALGIGLALADDPIEEITGALELSVEQPAPPQGSCELLPDAASEAIASHYEGRREAFVEAARGGDDWGSGAFAYHYEDNRCYSWGLDWLVYVYGGTDGARANVERHLWSNELLQHHGRTAPPINVEPERGMLRIESAEGGAGWSWIQRSWYSREDGWHRVASLPASVGVDSSAFRIESHFEFGQAAVGERLLTVRYYVPNVGLESTIVGELSSLGGSFQWSGTGEPFNNLMECRDSPTQGCPLQSLLDWVGERLGQSVSSTPQGPTRPIREVADEFTVLQAITDPPEHQAVIDQVLRSRNSQLVRCYERSTRGGTHVGRRFVATFDIEGGRVVSTEINGSTGSSWLDSCFVRRLEGSRFSGVDAMLALYLGLGEAE
jgi:hypothetical protein